MTNNSGSRRVLVLLAVVAAYICLIDRVAISIAVIPMVETYGWTPSDQGLVMSAFFIGYLVLQVPAGWMSDRWGGKWVLGFGVVFWSLFTALTPPSAALGLSVLVVCRFLMGVAESVTWPAIYNLFACWVPVQQRGAALGLLNSSIPAGTIIALIATPWLIGLGGWPWPFYVYGAVGLIWFAVWMPSVGNRKTAIDADAADNTATASTAATARDVKVFSAANLVRSKAVKAMVSAHFATNWVVFLALAWTPTYLSKAFELPLERVGLLSMIPFAVSAVATPLAGRLGDVLLTRGVERTRLRRVMQSIALFGMASVYMILGYFETVGATLALLCFGNLCASTAVAGFGANPMDIAPRYSATLYGISNAIASLGSGAAVYVAGLVLASTGSWALVFQTAALVAILGGIIFWVWGSAEAEF